MGPAYRIVTGRLVIRCWEPADAPSLKAAIDGSLAHLRRWMPWAHNEPQELPAKVEFLRRKRGEFDLGQDFTYGVFDRAGTEALGSIGLHPRIGPGALEVGYWIRGDRTNQGFTTEATAAVTTVAFLIHQVNRVEIHCDPANTPSLAIPRRLGFQHEATLRQRYPMPDGGLRDTMVWTLFAPDYLQSAVARTEIEAYDVTGARVI